MQKIGIVGIQTFDHHVELVTDANPEVLQKCVGDLALFQQLFKICTEHNVSSTRTAEKNGPYTEQDDHGLRHQQALPSCSEFPTINIPFINAVPTISEK